MRSPPWLQSLIPRLQSLQSLLSRSLSRLLPPCPRRPNPRRPHQSRSEEVGHPGAKTRPSLRRRCRPKRPSQHRLRARAASKGSPSRACKASRGALGPGSARGARQDDARPRTGHPVHAAAGPVHGAPCPEILMSCKEKMMPLERRNEPQMLRQFSKMYPSYNLNPLLRRRHQQLVEA